MTDNTQKEQPVKTFFPKKETLLKLALLFLAVYSLALFFRAYWPARQLTFLVEQWEFYYFYSQMDFDPLRLTDWLTVAFRAPFRDFRFIPLAYSTVFFENALFGNNNTLYLGLSLMLHMANGLLLAVFIRELTGKASLVMCLPAFCLSLVFPGNFETLAWTFFCYKILNLSAILLALICWERSLNRSSRRYGAAAVTILTVSWLFYESSVLLGLVFLARPWLMQKRPRPGIIKFCILSLLLTYIIYGSLYFLAYEYVPDIVGLQLYPLANWPSILALILSGVKWLGHGMLLLNLGLPIEFVPTYYQLKFQVLFPWGQAALVFAAWLGLGMTLKWRLFPYKNVLYLILLGFFGTMVIWGGRTLSNGTDYLAYMGLYQHFPSLMLAAVCGFFITHTLAEAQNNTQKAALVLTLFIVITILGTATKNAVSGYVDQHAQVRQIILSTGQYLEKHPKTMVLIPEGERLPFTPDHSPYVNSRDHMHNVLHLIYGDRIIKTMPQDKTPGRIKPGRAP